MASRSAMWGLRAGELRRCQGQGYGEDCTLPRSRAARGDVSTHAARQLARNRQSQARAVCHAIAAAAVVEVEQLVGDLRSEAATPVTDVQPPASIAHDACQPHA